MSNTQVAKQLAIGVAANIIAAILIYIAIKAVIVFIG